MMTKALALRRICVILSVVLYAMLCGCTDSSAKNQLTPAQAFEQWYQTDHSQQAFEKKVLAPFAKNYSALGVISNRLSDSSDVNTSANQILLIKYMNNAPKTPH